MLVQILLLIALLLVLVFPVNILKRKMTNIGVVKLDIVFLSNVVKLEV